MCLGWSVLRMPSLQALCLLGISLPRQGPWVLGVKARCCVLLEGRGPGIPLGQPQSSSVQTPIFNPTPIPCFSCFECCFLLGCFCLVFKFLFLLFNRPLPHNPLLVLVWTSNAVFCPGLISLSTLIPTHSVSMTTQPQHLPP